MSRLLALVPVILLVLGLAACSDDDDDRPIGPGDPGGEVPGEPGTTHWWNDQVFYEVFVRSFQDSDGDGVGDLQGLIQRLDYLNDGDPDTDTDLGVTALWLMPIVQSPSYHGYDATDYREVESDYGTNADFQQLMAEAHARGMRVIVDYVMNHCSDQHPWFVASAAGDPDRADWFTWRASNPGWTQPWGSGPVWHYSGARDAYYYGIFWSGMPDLNYAEPAVEAEMFDTATFWLDDMGADGFRLDAVKYLMEEGDVIDNAAPTFDFWSRFRDHLDTVAPEAFTVGEAWDTTPVVQQYVDAGLHACFEFDLAERLVAAADTRDAFSLRTRVAQVVGGYPYLQFATFLANHDQQRVFSQLGQSTARNKVAAALLLTLPGVPFLFYGEEVGMISSWNHEDVRRPMHWDGSAGAGFTTGTPWQPPAANVGTHNVADMRDDEDSLWNHYRRLVQARVASPALRRGTYQRLATGTASVYGFLRLADDQTVLALHNLAAETQAGWDLSAAATALAPGEYEAVDLLTGEDLAPVTVDADGAIANWNPVAYLTGASVLVAELVPAVRE